LNEKDWDFVVYPFVRINHFNSLSILYTLNEKDWDDNNPHSTSNFIWSKISLTPTNLFYIPWMKRIETLLLVKDKSYSIQLPNSIYSIYLEWKGLRRYILFVYCPRLMIAIYSIYLEWKGLRQYSDATQSNLVAVPLHLFYIPWMKRIETLLLSIVKIKIPAFHRHLFYIPWMKRIETRYINVPFLFLYMLLIESILYTLNEKDWDFNRTTFLNINILSIYSIYLEWKGLRLISGCCLVGCVGIYSIYLEWKGLRQ